MPATDAFVHALAKLEPEAFGFHCVNQLLSLWGKPWARKYLFHVPAVTSDLLQLLSHPPERINWSFVFRACQSLPGQTPVTWGLETLVREWQQSQKISWPYKNLGFESIDPAIENLRFARVNDALFPVPPMEGTETIRPILTRRALYLEGTRMQNCAFTYAEHVEKQRGYFYHLVRHQSDCTVLLSRREGYWACVELSGFQNGPPSMQAVEEVMHWLRNAYPLVDALQLDGRSANRADAWDENLGPPELPW